MSWRGLHFSEAASLRLKQGQLQITRQGMEDVCLPLEDIAFMVLESLQITASTALLAACAEQGILVLACDQKHMPCGALLPFNQHYRQSETTLAQLKLAQPKQKRLWQEIICHKIRNQATCLQALGRSKAQVRKVAILEQKVKSGDPDNVEAQAARQYWPAFHGGFAREAEAEDRLNAMLNYGYAVVRSSLAAELAGLGFITCLGLHHRSLQNAFNMADDLIESWRPFVDRLVMRRFEAEPGKDFTLQDRQALCGVLHEPVLFEGGEVQLLAALRRQAGMLKGWAMGRRNSLEYADFPIARRDVCQPME